MQDSRSPAPPGKAWKKRNKKWVLVDKQIVLWQRRTKREAKRRAKEGEKIVEAPFAKTLFS